MSSAWWSGLQEMAGRSLWVRYAVVLASVLLVVVLGYLIRLHDVRNAYQQSVVKVRTLEQLGHDKQQRLMALGGASESLSEVEARLQDVRWRLAAGAGMSELLDQLAASGRIHGLLVERLDVGAEIVQSGYRRVLLQLQVTGRYTALRPWLDGWLRQIRLLQVTSLQLQAHPLRPGLLQLQMEVQAFHPGEDLAAPRSLAREPARQLPGPPRSDPYASWSTRRSTAQGLVGIPLEQLEMVGSLARSGRYHALVRWAGRLYRVAEGERLGREEGEVVRIDEISVEVRERLFIAGQWQERAGFLMLNKGPGTGIMDERETAVGVVRSDGAVDADSVGQGL